MAAAVAAEVGDAVRSARGSRRRLRAVFSSGATTKSSPASATSDRPSTCTGVDGPASLTWSPLSSMRARTRPQAGAGHERVADPERAPLDEDGGHRAPADVEVGLEHDARGPARRGWPAGPRRSATTSRLLEQVVDAEVLQGGDLDHDRVAAPRLGHRGPCSESCCMTRLGSAFSRSILLMATTIGTSAALAWLSASMRLGHHAVVGRDHQHDDVGGLGAAGPHGGERLVARACR